jgi:hypothetical protein
MNAARPEQVGRLPGYTNCKEKYRQSNGYFPYVRLRKWKDRYATFHPLEGAACKIMRFEDSNLKQPTKSNHYQPTASNHWQPKTTKYQVKSQSHIDFRIACDMVRAGSSDIDIHLRLEKNLQLPGRTKKTKSYISTTIRNARKAVGVGQ